MGASRLEAYSLDQLVGGRTVKLVGSDGQSMELTIQGYQFPEHATAKYDSNWLIVAVEVSNPRGAWRASDPCLLTYEVARLAEWLEAVAEGGEPSPQVGFIEPNLEFHVVQRKGGRVLRVLFGLELRPTWAQSDLEWAEEVSVEFPIGDLDLQEAAQDLRQQLRRYPQRAAV